MNIIFKIIEISGNGIIGEYYTNNTKMGTLQFTDETLVEPILISPNLLEGFNFIKHKTDNFGNTKFKDSYDVEIFQLGNGAFKFIGQPVSIYDDPSDFELIYIHQLQNKYFKLFNRELFFNKSTDNFEYL